MIIKGEEIHSVHIDEEEEDNLLITVLLIRYKDGRQKYLEFQEDIKTAYRIKEEN